MNFPSEDKIFAGITWRSIVFFLVGSVMVAYRTVILCSVVLSCSPFLWFTAGFNLVPLGGFGFLHWFEQCLPLGGFEETCGVFYHSLMGRTFGIHTCRLWCRCVIQARHSLWSFTISQRVCVSLFFFLIRGMKPVRVILKSTNSSACRVGAYPVHHLILVFLRCLSLRNQLQRMRSTLDLEGHYFHAMVSSVFSCLRGRHRNNTCKSWVIVNCSLSYDELGKIFQTWNWSILSNGIRYVGPLVDQIVRRLASCLQ